MVLQKVNLKFRTEALLLCDPVVEPDYGSFGGIERSKPFLFLQCVHIKCNGRNRDVSSLLYITLSLLYHSGSDEVIVG